tara:strand:- start:417 stop:1754 length:1338 start_codon:yes stop_codon:yes gene_type:complete
LESLNNRTTIAAIATPPGTGAIAIIRLSGPCLKKIIFSVSKKSNLSPRQSTLSNIYNPKTNKLLDKCIITFFNAPKSFTGEDVLEISCHGGNLIPQLILESLFAIGVKKAAPGEFSYRAFLNNKIDLIQAESISALISSETDLNHEVSLKNLNGFFSSTVNSISDTIKTLLTILENELNFSENDISFTSKKSILNNLNSICNDLTKLNNTSLFGKVISSGYKIVLLGKPNAGKSSLFNHLLGKDRAIVSDIAGTTRDTIEGRSEISGIPVCFVDTAGYWESSDFLESLGIEKTIKEINDADFVLFVDETDPTAQFKNFNININKNKLIYILSKQDNASKPPPNSSIISISIKTGHGINDLFNKLSSLISTNIPDGPIITSARQKNVISSSLKTIKSCIKLTENNYETDILVAEIQEVSYKIESLIGKVYSKEIVNNIFKSFCVGK